MSRSRFPVAIHGWMLLCLCVLAGCATVGPDYHRPEVSLPATFAPTPAASTQAPVAPGSTWWSLYQDPVLDALMTSALISNLDLQQAIARIEEADANLRIAGTALLPEIDLNSSASRSHVSTRTATSQFVGNPVRNNIQFGLSTNFEIDFWGKYRRAAEAARAEAMGTRFARDTVALSLTSLVAQTYFTVRALDVQIQFTGDTLDSRTQSLELVRKQTQGGIASDFDLSRAVDARAAIAPQLKDLQQQRAFAGHQLGLLLGQPDYAITPSQLRTLLEAPVPPAGLPSTLLNRRPDVRAAEQQLIADNAQIGVARAAMLPTISLTGNLGTESADLAGLIMNGAEVWSIGYGLALPIFDAGRLAAQTDARIARQKQSLAAYQKAAQSAFTEVADALTAIATASSLASDLATRVAANRDALRVALARYEAGYSGYLDLLDVQRTLNDVELELSRNRQTQLTASVDLIKALGGEWE